MISKKKMTRVQADRINAVSASKALRVSDSIARALVLVSDAHAEKRDSARQCQHCYYVDHGGIAGQAFTEWECRFCNYGGNHANTNVPQMCDECADDFHLCVECGGSRDMGQRSFKFLRVRSKPK